MAATQYEEALRHVQCLSPADQKRLLVEVSERLGSLSEPAASITQLAGLEKDVWQTLDAQEYVHQERSSWNR